MAKLSKAQLIALEWAVELDGKCVDTPRTAQSLVRRGLAEEGHDEAIVVITDKGREALENSYGR